MSKVKTVLSWFFVILLVMTSAWVFLNRNRRAEPGKNYIYSTEEFQQVDPALIHYVEVEPLVPSFGNPSSLAIAPVGQIYVGGPNCVEVFPDGEKIQVPATPTCLAVDDDGILFAGFQDYILVFSKERKSMLCLSPSKKAYLTSIAVDEKWIYAADAGNRRVWRYNKEGGNPIEIGAKDEVKGVRGFYVPSPFFDLDIAVDGSVWVVNPGYHALENYSSEGRLISSWEKAGFNIDGFSGCCNPAHFALMPDGSFVTAEKGLPRVKIHNPDGSLRCVVAGPDQFNAAATGLDVAADLQGKIYVLDPDQGKVRVFEKKKQ